MRPLYVLLLLIIIISLHLSVSPSYASVRSIAMTYGLSEDSTVSCEWSLSSDTITATSVWLFDSSDAKILNCDGYSSIGLKAGAYTAYAYDVSGVGTITVKIHNYPATCTQEPEPNNATGGSQEILLNSSVEGRFGFVGGGGGTAIRDSIDWWKFTLPADGNLSLSVSAGTVYLYDSDGTTLMGSFNSWPPLYLGLKAGTYNLKFDGGEAAWGCYSITNSFSAESRVKDPEPNDSQLQAKPMQLNDSVEGRWGHVGGGDGISKDTVDWWKFTLPDDGNLSLSVETNNNSRGVVYLYDSDGTTLLGSFASISWTPIYIGLKAGSYYVKFVGELGWGGYFITNSFSAESRVKDPEPNDSQLQAKTMQLNDSVEGRWGHVGGGDGISNDTVDWWKITLPDDGNMSLSVSAGTVYLYDSDGTTLLGSYNSASWLPLSIGLKAGEYYVKFINESVWGGYTISNSFSACSYTLTATLQGSGSGSVNSNPSGFSCGSNTCTTSFPCSAQVTLLATNNWKSIFGGWGGDCSGTVNCSLTMNNDKTVIATFDLVSKAMIASKEFSNIQNAYNDVATTNGSIIKLLEGVQTEALIFGRDISFKLEGGYNSNYDTINSATTIHGSMKIKAGTVRVKGINVK